MEFKYANLTDAGDTTLKAQSETATGRSFVRVDKILICNTDSTEVEVDLYLYDASISPNTVKILDGAVLSKKQTLDVFEGTPFEYDAAYDLKAGVGSGHTADIICNFL